MELNPPPPPDWIPLDGAWKPLFDELLDELFELPELLDDPLEPLEPVPDVEPVEPEVDPVEPDVEPVEPDVEPVDWVEPVDDLLPVLVADAWLDPGRITATIPATATLATDTDTVVAFSLLRPCSRSATARATFWLAPCSFQLFTHTSVTSTAVSAVGG